MSKEYVYCTECKWLTFIDGVSTCKYENKCDIFDCEDSRSREERPYYKRKKIPRKEKIKELFND